MTCGSCGCSELDACLDERTGLSCSWASPGLCSACVDDDVEQLQAEPEPPGAPLLYDAYGGVLVR